MTSLALATAFYLLYRTGWRAIRNERDVAVHRDLERQRAEKALRESESLYRSLFDSAPVGIGIADLEGNLIAYNNAMLQPGGYTREDIANIGNAANLYFDTAQRGEALALAEEQGFLNHHEVRFTCKDGIPYDTFLSLAPVTIGGRKRWLAVAEDINERKLLHEQLLQAQKMEIVGQLAGGIAHDFNNLLTPILGFSEMAAGEISSDHPVRHYLDQVSTAALRASSLTQRLLTFSRLQVNEPKLINLNDIILGTAGLLRHSIGDDIEVAHLPAPDLGTVRVDPGQMEQVLLNMAGNARDAMPHGGKLTIATANLNLDPHSTLVLARLTPGPYVRLSVSDTGVGMDEEVQPHLFELFFTTKGPGKGTGLGLVTCFGIVKESGGEIQVYSKPGQGSTFEVYLPRVEEQAERVAGIRDSAESTGGMETLLLVEDEPSVRSPTVEVLRRKGYTVLDAADGEEALQAAHERNGTDVDLLLTDVAMPRMGGVELSHRLRSLRPGVKVLFISGNAADIVARNGGSGANDRFLPKPFTPAAIAKKVREVLDAA